MSIPRLEELHAVVTTALVRKPGPLVGPEVRYLRKWLGWSGRGFARRLGLSAEHVSRIENGRVPISGIADRLLRVLVVARSPSPDFGPEDALAVGGVEGPLEIGVRSRGRSWRAVA